MLNSLPRREYRAVLLSVEDVLKSASPKPWLSGSALVRSIKRTDRKLIDPFLISAYKRLSRAN